MVKNSIKKYLRDNLSLSNFILFYYILLVSECSYEQTFSQQCRPEPGICVTRYTGQLSQVVLMSLYRTSSDGWLWLHRIQISIPVKTDNTQTQMLGNPRSAAAPSRLWPTMTQSSEWQNLNHVNAYWWFLKCPPRPSNVIHIDFPGCKKQVKYECIFCHWTAEACAKAVV